MPRKSESQDTFEREVVLTPPPLSATAHVRATTFGDLIAVLSDPAFVLRGDGSVAVANEALGRALSVHLEDLEGRALGDVLDIPRETAMGIVAEIFESDERVRFQLEGTELVELEATRITPRRQDRAPLAFVRFQKVGDLVTRYRRVVDRVATSDGTGSSWLVERRQLERELETLEHASRHDSLTGLADRGAFDEHMARVTADAAREGRSIALVILDVDDFKRVNDLWGHARGDGVLQAVASELREIARRPLDLVARIGGEEFAVVLSDASPANAARSAELVRSRIESAAIPHPDGIVTVSVGVACMDPSGRTNAKALFQAADEALYESKRSGKNRATAAC